MTHYSFLFPVAGKVLEILGSPLIKRLSLAWGMKDELEKLENTLSSIHAVLLDADEKQHQEGSHQLKDWLGKLKTALFEADDLLDDFQIHSLRHQTSHQSVAGKVSSFLKPGSNQLIFRLKMSNKIKKMRERFDEIASDRNKFNLAERLGERDVVMCREMTHSFVDESDVLGRSLDKENIIRLLVDTAYSEKLPVIPIIGIGGLGKTTLVQMVYNDRTVIDCFDLRIWVCVSDDFGLKNIILEILKSITGVDYRHLAIDQLQTLLRQNLQGKKYLLVLDDVWNEERDKWIKLMDLLTAGDTDGSKIIVTSRSELVAEVVAPTSRKYMLKALSDDDCFSLFLKWAFWEREEANQHPNLVEIGRAIVKKCIGVPLAVRTLGKLLYMKTEERDWVYVRDNDIWESGQGEDDILPALKLSYYHLPSHLKQCFAYCSLFPKNHMILQFKLVDIWRAQGLIRLEQYKTIEETGKEYIGLLISRGFLQQDELLGDGFYKMHDLVHDLALSVAKPDCISTTYGPVLHSSIKVQHLLLLVDNSRGDKIPNELLELKGNLRTFLFSGAPRGRYSTNSSFTSFIETSISSFKHLRVLQLANFDVKELPRSFGSLWHLRYLDMSFNICIKSLPNSLCNLVCLETLNLLGCYELEKLPEGLGKLTRLKTLYVTTKERCLPEKEITCLTALQVLCVGLCYNMEFLLSNDGMKCMSSLRALVIMGCRKIVSLPTNGIRVLKKLENVTIANCETLDLLMDDDEHYSETGGGRGGLTGLRSISIAGLPMLETLPPWLLYGANALKQISIIKCPNLRALTLEPLLGNLVLLQVLEIYSCLELKSLPNGTNRLTALKKIVVRDCPELVSRCTRETGEDWHKISHVPDIELDGSKI